MDSSLPAGNNKLLPTNNVTSNLSPQPSGPPIFLNDPQGSWPTVGPAKEHCNLVYTWTEYKDAKLDLEI